MREGLVLRSLLCTSVVVFALSSVLPFLLCLPVFGIFLCVSVFLYFLQSLNLTLVFLILKSFLLFLLPAFVFFPPFIHTVSKLYLLQRFSRANLTKCLQYRICLVSQPISFCVIILSGQLPTVSVIPCISHIFLPNSVFPDCFLHYLVGDSQKT